MSANIAGTSSITDNPAGTSTAAVEPVALEQDGWGEAIIEDDGLVTPDPGSRQMLESYENMMPWLFQNFVC